MRTALIAAGFIVLAPVLARADDAVAIVDKAVQATANSDLRLRRLESVVRSDRGTLFMPGGDMAVQRTAYLCPPDRVKYDATITTNGQRQAMVITLNGLLAWQQTDGQVQNLLPAQADSIRDGEADAWALITLVPLRKKGTTLKTLPAETINGKPAVGITVTRADRPDAQLYFDAASGLPMRVKIKVREPGLETTRQVDLGEYRDFDGIKLPTRITVSQNGRKIEDWTVQDYRCPDRLDEKVFQKPK
jgi:hypothetical protein